MVLKQNVLLRAIIVTVLPQFGKGVKVVSVKSDTRTPLNANQPEAIMSITLQDCFGHVCHPVEEFCSSFAESCMQCAQVCDVNSEPNQLEICAKECAGMLPLTPFKPSSRIENTIKQQHKFSKIITSFSKLSYTEN